jgi:hypothetical protein
MQPFQFGGISANSDQTESIRELRHITAICSDSGRVSYIKPGVRSTSVLRSVMKRASTSMNYRASPKLFVKRPQQRGASGGRKAFDLVDACPAV